MGYCEISNYYNKSKKWCLKNGYEWKIYDTNFENIINGLISLFIISNLEGWVEILYKAIDSNYESIVFKIIFFFSFKFIFNFHFF